MKSPNLDKAIDEFTDRHPFWFVLYVLVNIVTLGGLWFIRTAISYAIYIALIEVKVKEKKTKEDKESWFGTWK